MTIFQELSQLFRKKVPRYSSDAIGMAKSLFLEFGHDPPIQIPVPQGVLMQPPGLEFQLPGGMYLSISPSLRANLSNLKRIDLYFDLNRPEDLEELKTLLLEYLDSYVINRLQLKDTNSDLVNWLRLTRKLNQEYHQQYALIQHGDLHLEGEPFLPYANCYVEVSLDGFYSRFSDCNNRIPPQYYQDQEELEYYEPHQMIHTLGCPGKEADLRSDRFPCSCKTPLPKNYW